MTRRYRFFYHYNKHTKRLTVHFKKSCIDVQDIVCRTESYSKWNKTQPNLVMRGFAESVTVFNDTAYIN